MKALEKFHAFLGRRRRRLREEHAAIRYVVFCTIATRAFVPWALVLFDSLRRYHPNGQFVLLYVREAEEAYRTPEIPGVHVIGIDALVDAEVESGLRRRYGLAELCFALKPRLLGHCLAHYGERAIYLDSDIDVLGPLTEALVLLEDASIALTPHLDTPIPMDGKAPTSMTVLRAGACNAGFIGTRKCEETRQMLAWWDERVSRWGFLAPEVGFQGDQKWLDLAPSLFPGVQLLRDPGSNVGTWNLHSRTLSRDGLGKLHANAAALSFVHFSGFDPEQPEVLSRFQNRHHAEDQPLLMELGRNFAARVLAAVPRAAQLSWLGTAKAPKPGPATLTPHVLPDGAYRARIDFRREREGILSASEELALEVTITNTGPHPWPVARNDKGEGGIAITWHTRSANGAMLTLNNRRYFLPRDLAPAESLTMKIGLRVPATPGIYRMELDLVHEGFAWFADRGNPSTTVEIAVDAFDPG